MCYQMSTQTASECKHSFKEIEKLGGEHVFGLRFAALKKLARFHFKTYQRHNRGRHRNSVGTAETALSICVV